MQGQLSSADGVRYHEYPPPGSPNITHCQGSPKSFLSLKREVWGHVAHTSRIIQFPNHMYVRLFRRPEQKQDKINAYSRYLVIPSSQRTHLTVMPQRVAPTCAPNLLSQHISHSSDDSGGETLDNQRARLQRLGILIHP